MVDYLYFGPGFDPVKSDHGLSIHQDYGLDLFLGKVFVFEEWQIRTVKVQKRPHVSVEFVRQDREGIFDRRSEAASWAASASKSACSWVRTTFMELL